MIKNLNQDMSLRETEIPVATATQLEAYLFPEDTIHPPLSDRSAAIGKLLIRNLDSIELDAKLSNALLLPEEERRAGVPIGVPANQYRDLIEDLLVTCMHSEIDHVTIDNIPSATQVIGLASKAYVLLGIEAIGWSVAFGQEYSQQVRSME